MKDKVTDFKGDPKSHPMISEHDKYLNEWVQRQVEHAEGMERIAKIQAEIEEEILSDPDNWYFRLGTTADEFERLPKKIGDEYTYMGVVYILMAVEPTDQTVRCTDVNGVKSIKPMFYMVLCPLRATPEFEANNPGKYDHWKALHFPSTRDES